ncbi:RteC domain-containing protein [Albibacterium sp.]|uniref:RteC domain-containing protein n=1 Tax=Albibacterium sp. TaxID=2952885 RepID=UPI002CD59B6F|nr:RteC domain-containing protein [Albibacterium sp.]HUH19360.1 RteC domain-containing protein [Albibacterium sp.]
MKQFSDRLSYALETELYAVTVKPVSESEKLKEAIFLCKKSLTILKRYLSSYFFESMKEEVEFFKTIKPVFYSKYIYYIYRYNYHISKPLGSNKVLKSFITSQLAELKHYFDRNQVFYQYYRSGATQFDTFYFTRGDFNDYSELEDFQGDESFSTSHDYKISKVLANEQYQEFLIKKCKEINQDCSLTDTPIVWTGNQSDLVELLYALVESGTFNNGNVKIKTVILYFQTIFQVDLKYYYHKFTDISNRKKERTVFLDKLKAGLIRKMDSKNELKQPELKKIHFS